MDRGFSSSWFDWRKFLRQMNITEMENRRVELIKKRNMMNHLRSSQQQPKPKIKPIVVKVRPLARNGLKS